METIALILVAVAALVAAAATLVLALCFISKREKVKGEEPNLTKAELEAEQKRLEQQRLELEGIANQMAFSGFAWRDGNKK